MITDKALIAFEVFHTMKRSTAPSIQSFALKLDMIKAYDRVEWCFLERVMVLMGFSNEWVNRVMSCISSVSFSFKLNGQIFGNLTPTRGLRQGDPISPYLFLICADAFSTLISRATARKAIHGVKICRDAPVISHLFFADDSIIFTKASLQECSILANIISTYERASGQKVNYDKTQISFSKNVPLSMRQQITNHLGVVEVDRHEKYLGLPTIVGKSKKIIFQCIKERIWKKLQGWKEKLLSRAGKEILIKAVIQAIPTYIMSIFRIPDGLLAEINAMIARFWWGSENGNRKMHWHNWGDLCTPKSRGGLGFRDIRAFNKALLAKQVWRIHNGECPLLAAILRAKYFKHSNVLDANRGYYPSYTWRSLWDAKSFLKEGLCWRVGNGLSINVHEDPWIVKNGVATPLLNDDDDPSFLRVAHLIDFTRGKWDLSCLPGTLDDATKSAILSIPLSKGWPVDSLYWLHTKDGRYTVKSGYWLGTLGGPAGDFDSIPGHSQRL